MHVLVSCPATGKVEPGMDKMVCDELTLRLTQTYPEVQFSLPPHPAHTPDQMELTVQIGNATAYGLGLTLIWTTASGQRISGAQLAVSSMDRALTPDLRATLYNRIIAATPMPR